MNKGTDLKLDITFAIPGLPFNGNTFDKQSLGGSETAAYYMGRALAKLGGEAALKDLIPLVKKDRADFIRAVKRGMASPALPSKCARGP